MDEDIKNMKYATVKDYKYARWFEDVKYNGKTLNDSERRYLISVLDESIELYSQGLSIDHEAIERHKDYHYEFNKQYKTLNSIMLFTHITMIDSMVVGKYFLKADKDYERKFMRGKLFVLLNEGFKKLYGFNEASFKRSEWNRLLPLMKYLPEQINLQYQELTYRLEKQSKSSSWWKDERNYETHLDAENLYKSRQEEIIESKVMMSVNKLYSILLAINAFLSNVHACYLNSALSQYRNKSSKG